MLKTALTLVEALFVQRPGVTALDRRGTNRRGAECCGLLSFFGERRTPVCPDCDESAAVQRGRYGYRKLTKKSSNFLAPPLKDSNNPSHAHIIFSPGDLHGIRVFLNPQYHPGVSAFIHLAPEPITLSRTPTDNFFSDIPVHQGTGVRGYCLLPRNSGLNPSGSG